jgi:hypothetical protein
MDQKFFSLSIAFVLVCFDFRLKFCFNTLNKLTKLDLFFCCLFILAFPHCVYLNRGNHEQRRMNEKYHFEDQIRQRYDPELYDLILHTFLLLPLCTLIEHKVFILHGTDSQLF